MSASVSISNVSWSTPDGAPLFTNLTLSFGPERTGLVGRNGSGKTTLLRMIAGDILPAFGRVQVSGTLAMMRQEMTVLTGDTIADLFGARPALDLLDRAEAGLAGAEELAGADWTLPSRIEAALVRCDLVTDLHTPLVTLSGGQRTRAALAALTFAEPDFLLLDEPTNDLDRTGRQAVVDLIRGWKGGAIVVSHDRELLGEMDAIVELTSLGATRYGGNYSAFRQQKDTELDAVQRDFAHAEKTHAEIARRAQQVAERKARKDSRGHKARVKCDQPKMLMDAAKGRAETSKGANARLREARREAADEALHAAREKIEIPHPLHMNIPSTGLPSGRTVLHLDAVTVGYRPERPVIRDLSLTITGPERIAVAGPNGSGKTTLLKLITGQITQQRGRAELMVPFALLDQHVGLLDPCQSLLGNFLRLNASADERMARSVLARFGFRADDALHQVGDLSGGERLRAGLACVLGQTPIPMLLILDEPTNHLDLDGITALEAALTAYDGAVLVVSHDEAFLETLALNRTIELPV
jgi:ATPase subunit of ABC transporter with duplicated ATPase domains